MRMATISADFALERSLLTHLRRLGIQTTLDLLHYYPREHIIYRQCAIADLKPETHVIVTGKIQQHRVFGGRQRGLTLQTWTVVDEIENAIQITRFHYGSRFQSIRWRYEQQQLYRTGKAVSVCGQVKFDQFSQALTIISANVEIIDKVAPKRRVIQPIYALSKGISADVLRDCLEDALAIAEIVDPLPQQLRERFELMPLREALSTIHFPTDSKSLKAARGRLVFDEFFYLQLRLLQQRQTRHKAQRPALQSEATLLQRFYQVLSFELTQAQRRVIGEILEDFSQARSMNRLVQGDVGSGKTVVAAAAIACAIQAGYQVALMAPTEVLAEQHFQKMAQWFEPLQISVELLTGSTSAHQRRGIYARLSSGQISLIVGTHTLIQKSVQFHYLGLVVIDEQHRFGVQQRLKLQQKGFHPHLLSMTATPIPRTLSLTLHGNLDVSQIDELPTGRKPIVTKVLTEKNRPKVNEVIRLNLALDRQVFVILPLVEMSETLELESVIEAYDRYQHQFPDQSVGLLHGQMRVDEKQAAIAQFRNHQTQILVSTTVIEVGIDIPNATVIVIEHAERFGLSQLHQLRGRVGRGQAQSYCLLMNASDSTTAKDRLEVLEKLHDGFAIAEIDLQLRGSGEILGTSQAGAPKFALADLVKDAAILEQARAAAEQVVQKGERLRNWDLLLREAARRNHHKLNQEAALN
jgi:ATP-dependent DNA helicase RecG